MNAQPAGSDFSSRARSIPDLSESIVRLLGSVDARRADSDEQREAIFRLRYDAYRREGVISASPSATFSDSYDQTPNAYLIGLYIEGKLASSIRIHVASREYPDCPTLEVFPEILQPELDAGKIIIDGNAAAALGCVFAGVTVVTWYPITPSSSLVESMIGYLKRFRIDKDTGKATYAVVQAEDELSAIGMVLGAGWAGARSVTSTAGPGISLMSEFIGLGYYAEIPAVIFDVQRVGPSTGLPTRTAQGDILSTAVLSHGDTKHPLLFPCSPEECFTMAIEAFDLAEHFQTPVFVMTDLDLGMNNWMADAFEYPTEPIQRGKVLTAADLDRLGGFARYKDLEGDGVGYRTLPGTNHPQAAYFTRGSGHNEKAQYTEREDDYVHNVDRLAHKFESMRSQVPPPVVDQHPKAEIGLVAFGTSHYAVDESRDQLKAEYGIDTSYLRLKAYPFTPELLDFIRRHERVYVVEQNRDAQLLALMRLEYDAEEIAKLRSMRYYGGLPIDARTVTDDIIRQEGK